MENKSTPMTTQEKNEAVARKLNHTGCKGACPAKFDDESDYEHLADAGTCLCPDYCGSIAAAWEIVEKFKEYQIEKLKGPTEYYARLGNVSQKLWSKATTASEAIVEAFLKLNEKV